MTDSAKQQYDKMTKTPIYPLLISLSIPTIITMLVTSVYNMADTAFVGTLGTSESGAVGVVFGFMAILQAIGFFFGQGCGTIMSRELGAKKQQDANISVSTGFFMSLIISVCVAVITFFNLDVVVTMLGSTKTIAPYAKTYIKYILISTPFIVPSFTLNNILRFEGRAKLGAIGMMSGAILNISLDAVFMFIFNMGIAGAGLATCLSQIISFIILFTMFLRKKTQTVISFRLFTNDVKKLANIAGTGLPSLLRQSLQSVSVVVLNYLAKPYGDPAISAMSIVSRITFFVFSIGLGFGQGFQPISSFNFGAKKYARVREAHKKTLIVSQIMISILSIIVLIFSKNLIRIFRDDAEVILIGTRALRLQIISLISLPYCMSTEMLLQTTGNKLSSSILSSCRSGIIFVPVIFILAYTRGLSGIQEAQPLTYVLSCIPTFFFLNSFLKKLPKEDVDDVVSRC